MTPASETSTVIIPVDEDDSDSFRLWSADLRWEAAHAEYYAEI